MKKILVVESSTMITRHLKREIEKCLDFEVLTANNYLEGSQLIDSEGGSFFAAVLGLSLPDAVNGEIVDYARKNNIPSIVFTGTDNPEIRKKILVKKVVDYVLKDSVISIKHIVQLIDRLQKNLHNKLLIVSHAKLEQRYIANLLGLHQYQVFQAGDGVEALEVLEKEPDIMLILTDFDMPRMDGVQLTRKIRAKIPNKEDIAIVGMSGQGQSMVFPKFLKNGANDFISKPFLTEEFYCRIVQNIEVVENTRQLKKFFAQEKEQKRIIKLAFSQYLSPKVVDSLIASPEKLSLGGESREMTVFFSDLAGFTALSEQMKPEELVQLLNEYLSDMCNVILEHDGTVDKFIGDAIMAFWGAPLDQPDHAELACFAAFDMQQYMVEFRREMGFDEGTNQMGVRMGINSGPMVVGNMGSRQRMNYTIMGDAVNLASRLEGANKFYTTDTIISQSTYDLAKESIEARELDTVKVVGKNDPVTIYQLMGRKGKIPDASSELIFLFHDALAAYKARVFGEAMKRFEKVLKMAPHDGPSQCYMSRCQSFLQASPPPGWDGVFQLTSKG